MKTYTVKIESGVQIRIESVDENMKIYDGLISYLDNSKDVKCIKKAMTFETPISDYEYKDIPFSVLLSFLFILIFQVSILIKFPELVLACMFDLIHCKIRICLKFLINSAVIRIPGNSGRHSDRKFCMIREVNRNLSDCPLSQNPAGLISCRTVRRSRTYH